MKRLLDIALSSAALLVAAPVIALGALGVLAASPGPVFYRARRIGRHGRPFTMYKLRTMHVTPFGAASVITAHHDPRVFRIGALLRQSKIDELPQLFNVLSGDMSIVGPRPEDPKIVEQFYTEDYRETLSVRPGLASPGSIYNYTHGEQLLSTSDPERDYVEKLLPVKMAIDVVYVRRASVLRDLVVIVRTAHALLAVMAGRRAFSDPPEMPEARSILTAWGTTSRASARMPRVENELRAVERVATAE